MANPAIGSALCGEGRGHPFLAPERNLAAPDHRLWTTAWGTLLPGRGHKKARRSELGGENYPVLGWAEAELRPSPFDYRTKAKKFKPLNAEEILAFTQRVQTIDLRLVEVLRTTMKDETSR